MRRFAFALAFMTVMPVSARAQDSAPARISDITQSCIGVLSSSAQTTAERESDYRHFLDDGPYSDLVRVAKCLAARKHFDEAVAIMKPIVGYYGEDGRGFANTNARAVNYYPYQAWYDYALILDAKRDRKGAAHAMTIAYSLSKEVYADKQLLPDYKRLAAANIATARTQQRKAEATRDARKIARSRRFWDACSADQRRILVMKGGKDTNRDHNVGEDWGPSRIQTYETANYREEVWWYYGLQGEHSAEAFTFRNGRLVSHYES
jgi:hypothetical protein